MSEISEVKPHPMNPENHDLPAEETPLVNVNFNGKWVKVPKGMNVVEVTKRMGDFLPHYCYHEKLPISGNCRMCLFEMGMPKAGPDRKPILGSDGLPEGINWLPRPMIGCATQVTDGMGIRTQSPLAQECRKGVMEFLLINHPLDCPICDQAGECKLQEFSSEYGTAESRFVEEKVKKPKNVDLGERIVLDDERCVLCSRCVRFAKDVVQDDVLGFVNRGSYNTLTAHPGKRFDNPYSLNTVDICPVGALTSKDFRFKMRVWFLKETKSICTGCATGCNITIGAREGTVYRLTPRANEAVNSHWMCDYGRLDFDYLHDKNRIQQPLVKISGKKVPDNWPDVFQQIGNRIKQYKGEEIAILASARMCNEELYLLKKWADELGVTLLDTLPRSWDGDTFLKANDRNPNSKGAELLGVSQQGKSHHTMVEDIKQGAVKCVISFHEDWTAIGVSEEDLARLELNIAIAMLPNATTEHADYVLPGSGFAEKRGSMINKFGRLQRLNQAVLPPGEAKEEWEILKEIRLSSSGGNGVSVIEDVFRAMANDVKEFAGLSLSKIGDLGIEVLSERGDQNSEDVQLTFEKV